MIGEKLRKLRISKNLNQDECAKLLNVSKSTIGMWETNKRMPDVCKLVLISNVFNVSIDSLLNDEPIKHIEINVSQNSNAVYIIDKKGKLTTYLINDNNIKVVKEFAKALAEDADFNNK